MKSSKQATTRQSSGFWRTLGTVYLCLFILIAFLCFFAAQWYVSIYGRIGFDSVLYTLTNSLGGVQSDLITKFLSGAVLPALLCTLVVCIALFYPWKKPFRLKRWIRVTTGIVLSLCLIVHAAFNVELVKYILAQSRISALYENEYVDPSGASITFPEEKRNLVYIILESMETSYLSKDQGGALEYNLIPELYDLANNNTNFSHNNTVGGFREVPGSSWTVGSLVSQTSGVPLKTPEGIKDWQNGYGEDGVFLPGLTTMFEVLKENGYHQSLMVGSDADFGGRETYYKTHGVDQIYDIYTARRAGIVPSNYFVWWGMEDLHLFDYAKQELTKIAAQEQPFAFSMLTVDTHHIGGYTCSLCGSNYEESYENAIACSSRQVNAFVQWLQEQDFYENTTVIITGDHCSMDKGYFSRNVDENYTRHVYNCFINAPVATENTKNRQFSALDMFPTTLAAMGCTIEGDRLGLGTNLFSDTPTLIEDLGYYAFSNELQKRAPFYNRFYGDDAVTATKNAVS